MDSVVNEFLVETLENLAQLDLDLLVLEKDPHEPETLARVFRTLHTVKGAAGFLGFAKLEALAHAGESLLADLRDGRQRFGAEAAGVLLTAVDAIRQMLASIQARGQDGDGDYSAIIARLQALREVRASPSPAAEASPAASPAPVLSEPSPEAFANWSNDSTIRVDVGLLDRLMNLVGELVLARNQIEQYASEQEDAGFLGAAQRLNLLTTELQAGVMKTRMQPIGNVWNRFPRVVRDLALSCGKQVEVTMEGKETELDKTIIEAIRDPLAHLLRNAVDHGIEAPAERVARSKPAMGRVALRAFHEGGKVIIEMTDDGGGIDVRRIRDRAAKANLISGEQAVHMTDHELVQLIFLPGFSTADRVTNVSGRGVGMDVVRTDIERIGGTVDVHSSPGVGTTFKMKIPLTLAIIPALTVACCGGRYAIPQVSLLELVRLEAEQARSAIEQMHGAPVYRLRGELLPLVFLDRLLGLAGSPDAGGSADFQTEGERRGDREANIVVLQADERRFGLIVDSIHDTEEIVVKPLQKQLKGINVFAGATIMGDGRVVLILDVLGIAQRASVIAGVRERSLSVKSAAAEERVERQMVLLFETARGGRMAVPLEAVTRLEEFSLSAIERAGSQDVVQYRDEILPLVHVSRVLARRDAASKGPRRAAPRDTPTPRMADGDAKVQVLVYSDRGRRVGLVIGRVLDIVEDSLVQRARASRPGVLFSAVIQERVTEFLDIESIIRASEPAFFDSPRSPSA